MHYSLNKVKEQLALCLSSIGTEKTHRFNFLKTCFDLRKIIFKAINVSGQQWKHPGYKKYVVMFILSKITEK